jgi:hypothetical protein
LDGLGSFDGAHVAHRSHCPGVSTLNGTSNITAAVLVEGMSDEAALTTLARRTGRDLDAEGVPIIAMGGASAIGESIERVLDTHGPNTELAGLCDRAEVGEVRRGLERAGLGARPSLEAMESRGFFVCVEDLEDELIRGLGVGGVELVIEAEGDLPSFRRIQSQPAWRERTLEAQLRRFMGTKSGRKARYAGWLVDALDLERVPGPLERVLAYVQSG